MNRSPLPAFFLIPLVLACFALSPQARAVDPPPDGGYPNQNTAEGENALFSLDTGTDNTALGFEALSQTTYGVFNTAVGSQALTNNLGFSNTAIGFDALYSNTTGFDNAATGVSALYFNTTGYENTATGFAALLNNTIGTDNTATGVFALYSNTTGSYNTAIGRALLDNTTGSENTATGHFALAGNGNNNTANGARALYSNTTGNDNTAIGHNALRKNTTGKGNIALGSHAGFNLTTGNNNIDIFDRGVAGEANTIRIGKQGTQSTTFVAGISGATVTGTAVVVNSSGQLGVAPSSQRFKQNIQNMGDVSDVLLALRPVTFKYKPDVDPKGVSQFGLVAEEVEKVNPDLVARDDQGKPYTVRYEAVNAMLLNEFLKEHREVQEQKATIVALESALSQQQKNFQVTAARQQTQIEALTAGLQKVSAQVEASRRAQQMVASNP